MNNIDYNKIRNDFILKKDEIYLDNAATTKRLKQNISLLENYQLNNLANINNKNIKNSITSNNIVENTRTLIKEFLNANKDDSIIFTKNATESLNIAISGILNDLLYTKNTNSNKEINIVSTVLDHSSLIVPVINSINEYNNKKDIIKNEYKKNINLKLANINDNYTLDYSNLEEIIDEKTNVLLLTLKSNVTGEIIKLDKVFDILSKKKSKPIIVADASQLIGQNKLDLNKYNMDFVCFSGHKIFSNFGVGVLYIKNRNKTTKNTNISLKPLLYGGRMTQDIQIDKTNNNYITTFSNDESYYEAGTMNIESILTLNTAINYINEIGIDNIQNYISNLTNYLYNKLKSEIQDIIIYSDIDYGSALVSFNIPNIHPHDINSILESNNIYIRSGRICAYNLVNEKMNFSVNRVSLSIYNTKEEIDIFVNTLKEIVRIFN